MIFFMLYALAAKIDIMAALKRAGYTSYVIQRDHIFGSSRVTRWRRGDPPSLVEIDRLCAMLHVQPGDLIEYIPDPPAAD